MSSAKSKNSTAGRSGDNEDDKVVKGADSRRLAIKALTRIEESGAYANLLLSPMLDRSDLSEPDRRFVTELVYGTTRMQRACDYLYERYLLSSVEPHVQAALRVGTYQLCYLGTPPHAAVSATVEAIDGKARSVVNAVLRRVSEGPVEFPDDRIRLSYPDWIIDHFTSFLGPEDGIASLEAMNHPAPVTTRADGYVQDEASQAVIAAMEPEAGQVIIDLCAAPGGKATGLRAAGARVVAADRRLSRARLVTDNALKLDYELPVLVADGRNPAVREASADQVLVDAPCSGLGSLRRRPDARWRIEPEAPQRLSELQLELLHAGVNLLRPGGVLTYSVCTLGLDEGQNVVDALVNSRPDLEPVPVGGTTGQWITRGSVAYLLPTSTDGMMISRLRRR